MKLRKMTWCKDMGVPEGGRYIRKSKKTFQNWWEELLAQKQLQVAKAWEKRNAEGAKPPR